MTVTRKGFLASLAAAPFIGRGIQAMSGNRQFMRRPISGRDIVVSGCVVRFSDPDGSPSIHANAAHGAFGVESVGIAPGNGWLEFQQTPMVAPENPIIFVQAQTDETLAGRGIIAGATGGTTSTRVNLYDTRLGRLLDLRNRADRMRVQGRNANLWVGWIHVPNAWK